MGYSKLSTNLANYICAETKLDADQKEVVAYSIENLMLGIAGFILILLIGMLFHAVVPACIAAVTGAVLRRFSGGAHSSTPIKCLIYGSLAYGTLGGVTKYISVYPDGEKFLIIGLIISLLLVSLYSPVDCAAKPIKSPSLRKKLKIGSVSFVCLIIVLICFAGFSYEIKIALTLGALYQSITLIPILNKRR